MSQRVNCQTNAPPGSNFSRCAAPPSLEASVWAAAWSNGALVARHSTKADPYPPQKRYTWHGGGPIRMHVLNVCPLRVIGEKQNCLELHLEDQEEEALPLVPVLLPARNVINYWLYCSNCKCDVDGLCLASPTQFFGLWKSQFDVSVCSPL
jgi:hypothetical protein